MTTIEDPGALELLKKPYHAVISTINADRSVHSTVVWADAEDGVPAVNSAVGRIWPTNLQRDPRVTLFVYNPENPYEFLEVRGTAEETTEGADKHIDRLAKKYLNVDSYPYRKAAEQRIKILIKPNRVRYVTPSSAA
jgi:PPOX class probable F420-dependent enzyme